MLLWGGIICQSCAQTPPPHLCVHGGLVYRNLRGCGFKRYSIYTEKCNKKIKLNIPLSGMESSALRKSFTLLLAWHLVTRLPSVLDTLFLSLLKCH